MCWTTTEAFHELYQKSRLARERFLHPVIKIEFDATISCSENLEPSSYGEQPIDICEMKNESNTGASLNIFDGFIFYFKMNPQTS